MRGLVVGGQDLRLRNVYEFAGTTTENTEDTERGQVELFLRVFRFFSA